MNTYPAEPHLQDPPEGCPDGGVCHHDCGPYCFRVVHCGPLSGVYDGNQWPDALHADHCAWRDNYHAEMHEQQHQEEMRELENQAMEEHFRRHPHG